MKILTVVGARPQFIKASAISRALKTASEVDEISVHTGQHYDYGMSDVFFDELDIPQPNYNLGIGSGGHGQQTGKMLIAIEQVLLEEKPDKVVVYGDTNSTLAGAIAAAKLHIPIAHVEAGLRSFNHQMPEEINRVLTDHASDYLFAPTRSAVQQLTQEGVSLKKIFFVGDVMYDVALFFSRKAEQYSHILKTLNLKSKKFCLATVHRAENTDNSKRLKNIFDGLISLSKNYVVVLPLHPRTKKELERIDYMGKVQEAIRLIDPIGYLDMVKLEKNARLVLTDSGGIQKEAYFLGVPCVVLRNETEWMELVDLGWNVLSSPERIDNFQETVRRHLSFNIGKLRHPQIYGNGNAASKILEILKRND
ncbi:MAG: UDP-N-acetylglucosamine 2-epimerase (non-hydrolyzing) [Cyanobacteria bacterium P01_A01_bin.137]